MRVRTMQGAMSLRQADILEAYLRKIQGVTKATVYDRTGDAVICYDAPRTAIIQALASFAYANEQALAPEHSSRAMSREFEDRLVASLCWRGMKQLFIPSAVRTLITVVRSVPYIKAGLNCLLHKKIQVPVLDAAAISVSMLRKDFETASSIMFLLGIGDILDEWTHKKSVADLAQTMSLNVDKVWKETDAGSVLVPVADVQVGDRIVVRTGGVIPLDGKVVAGAPAVAIEMPDGTIITGKTSSLLGASSACLLNALKYLGGIPKDVTLISPDIIEPIQHLKVEHLGNHNPRLHTDEVLVALSICAASDPTAEIAMQQLAKLAHCEAHSSVILSHVDENVFKKLEVNITFEPHFQTKKLFHR